MFSIAHAILSGLVFATESGRVLKFLEATIIGCIELNSLTFNLIVYQIVVYIPVYPTGQGLGGLQ